MIVKNKLLNFKNLYIYQSDEWFSFSLDSVLLANFVTIKLGKNQILDIGCGNAPIPLILTTKTKSNIVGVELQTEIYSLAERSVNENKLDNQIKLINNDIKQYAKVTESDTYDTIVSNPPFFIVNERSNFNENSIKSIARHELSLSIEDVVKISKKLLKNNGNLAIVHRTNRLVDILEIMRKNNIEPKKIQLVYPKVGKESNIFLLEGTKNGKSGLKVLEPLYIHEDNGDYREQIKKFFE